MKLLTQNYCGVISLISGQTNFIINHFRELAQKFTNNFKLKKNDLVVDIGSNDGTFLNFFKKKR